MFTNPLGLALLLAVPFLVLAYRKRKSAKTQVVSSLMILKTLSTRPVPKKRIKLPFRFYIEAAALLALAIASALPVIKPSGKKIAVLIDNSMSMSATNSSKRSRLDLAVENFKNEKSSIDNYTIFESSPKLNTQAEEIKTAAAPDNLINAVNQLVADTSYDKIWIFSDKKITTENPILNSYTVGTAQTNVYIDNATLNKNSEGEQVSIRIALSGSKATKVNITLNAIDFSGNVTKKIGSETLTVAPQKVALVNFTNSDNELAYKVEINPSMADAIAVDNTAWLVGNPEPSSQILLVSADANGLEKIPGFKVQKLNFEEFANINSVEKYSLVVFHHSAPASALSKPTLLILPPSDNEFFPASAEQTLKISSWKETHPINSYLRVNLIKPNTGVEFKTPNWAEAVISGEKGSIIAAGQYKGTLIAASGIELLPYEGKKTPALSILTVNLIKWLTNSQHLSAEKTTGDPFSILPATSWLVVRPDQKIIEFKPSEVERNIELDLPGIYLFSKQGSSSSAIGVNCFHAKESETNTIEELNLTTSQAKKRIEESKLWKYLTSAAIALLMIEMLIRIYEGRRVA